jgi:hypothetical protein
MHSCVQKWNGVILPDRAGFPTDSAALPATAADGSAAPAMQRGNYRIKMTGRS